MTIEDERPVTIESKANYLEPVELGTLVCTAKIRKGGKRFTIVASEVTRRNGKPFPGTPSRGRSHRMLSRPSGRVSGPSRGLLCARGGAITLTTQVRV